MDGQVGIGAHTELSGWAGQTETPGLTGQDHGFGLGSSFSSPFWRWRAGYTEIGEDFNPEVGFLGRSGYRQLNGYARRRFRPAGEGRVKEFGPRVYYDSFWGFDGFHQTQRYSLGGEVEFRSGAQISLSAGGNYEGLEQAFEIHEGITVQSGEYDHNGVFIFMNTNRGRAVSLFASVQAGGFFGGDQLSVSPMLNVRLGDYLTSDFGWSYNDIELPGGAFKTNLGRLRVTYAFSTRLLLQALIQYKRRERQRVDEPALQLAERGEPGTVPGLQRDLGVRVARPAAARPQPDREVQPRLRCVPLAPPGRARLGAHGSPVPTGPAGVR